MYLPPLPHLRPLLLALAAASCVLSAAAQNTTVPASPSTTAPTITASSSSSPAATAPIPLTTIVPDGLPHKFEARDRQFWIDGQPTILVSGEMHFGRVQPEDWETRIQQAKAMGLNTLSFYLFWNQVEPEEGQFDFTGMNDVRRVLQLCQKYGIWAVLRPGPYCCAEIEYGGIPYWTLKYPDVKIRVADPKFLSWCQRYINEVYKQVADLQVTHGGPLVMVQIDNEYGITAPANNDYMVALHKIFLAAGFNVPLYMCDPGGTPEWRNPAFRLPGVLICRNGLRTERDYQSSADAIGDGPVFVPEMYTAWFSGWGEPIATRHSTLGEITGLTNFMLDHKFSFNYYLFFGGTNYGFDNGCNFYLPVQTSYDYSAPIDEAGRLTPKYNALRAILAQRLNRTFPAPPPDPPVITISASQFNLRPAIPLLFTLPKAPTLTAAQPVTMESLGQAYGFVLYRKQFPNGLNGTLVLNDVMDYTFVLVNGQTVAQSFRGLGLDSNTIAVNQPGNVTLDLLVYNLGRISVITSDRTQYLARKGIVGNVTLNGQTLSGWDMYSLPYANGLDAASLPGAIGGALPPGVSPEMVPNKSRGPSFVVGNFTVDQVGGTFLDLSNWTFGAVWVNGHNLGRYWNRGGLRSLFLPREWLHPGSNDIQILELGDRPKNPTVTGVDHIVSAPPIPFPYSRLTVPPTS